MQIKQHIFIVGMMGTGKTSLGKKLAKRLACSWFDTDQELEAGWGYSISTYFDRYGEAVFRQAEQEMLYYLCGKRSSVITTGGGIVLNPENCNCMKQHGLVIGLTAHPEELIQRLKNDHNRPLLAENVEGKVWELVKERADKYQFADLMIDTTGKATASVAEEVWVYLTNSLPHRSS